MKQKYLLILLTALVLLGGHVANAQMVGTDIFFPGHYLELGQNNVGALGTSSSPAGYNPNPGGGGTNLAVVYDAGHDGWAAGFPPYFGDYTYPGTPYEGWEIQVDGVRSQGMTTYAGSTSPFVGGTLTGANISYSNVGGMLTGNWTGSASSGNLTINMTSVMDTGASQMVFTVKFKNISTVAIPDIYYLRTCDPDDDETYSGSFSTNNTILHQNEDASHSVEADSYGQTYLNHWSICTKDCRAVAFLYTQWSPVFDIGQDLADVWNQTATSSTGTIGETEYALGGTQDGDFAIGVVFNVGTIAPGDSAVISYAYVFDDSFSSVNTAFPDPVLQVNGVTEVTAPPPVITIDTFNACLYPTLTTLPVNILNGNSGTWSWATWKWLPTIGLSSDTGLHNSINLTSISTAVTYTITGSDSSSFGTTCNHQVFYFTVLVCNNATNNAPCVGDTLRLVEHGDSTNATYLWYGPGGFTSTLQNPVIYPAVFADSGTYHVVKTVDGIPDTGHTDVIITQPSYPGVSGNVAYCQNVGPFVPVTITTLPGATAQWYVAATGGYPSSDEPTVDLSSPGSYTAYVSQLDSTCESLREPVVITVNPTPPAPTVTNPVYCLHTITPALTATGPNLKWYGPGLPVAGTTVAPHPNAGTPAIESYYVTETSIFGCTSDSTLDRVTVLPTPVGPLTTDLSYCQFAPTAALTAVGIDLMWYIGGVRVDSTPVPPNVVPGIMTWYATQNIDSLGITCQSDSTPLNVTTVYLPRFTITAPPFVCQFDSINLSYTGPYLNAPGYSWVIPNGSFIVDSTIITGAPSIAVQFDSANQNNYVYLTTSDNNGFCQTTDTLRINVVPEPTAKSYTSPNICINDTTALSLASKTPDAANFVWKIDGVELSSSTAVNIVASDANSGGPYSISWTDSGLHIIQLNTTTVEGCPSLPTFDSVYVRSIPDASFTYKTREGSFCIEDSVLFTAITNDETYLYTWSPERAFNNVNKWEEWGKVLQNESAISLTITTPYGCSATTTQELTPGSCCTVAFPNAFTPSNDNGLNILFRPIAAGYHNYHDFRITNRWGQLIFSSASSNVAWDGTFNGVPQDGGVYFYYLKYDCGGNSFEQKGDVTLIR